MKCPACDGDGYTVDVALEHSQNCDGSCVYCPVQVQVQVQCETCGGEGNVYNEEE